MKTTDVTDQDMKACADVLTFFQGGEFILKGNQAGQFYDSLKWLQSVAIGMMESRAPKKEVSAPAVKEPEAVPPPKVTKRK